MPSLLYLPPWDVAYDYSTTPAVERTPDLGGFTRQSRVSLKRVVIANARRVLRGAELPYFEAFVREILNDGSLKFTDTYADHTGLATGIVRIVDGVYSVSTDKITHVVSCQIEIFR